MYATIWRRSGDSRIAERRKKGSGGDFGLKENPSTTDSSQGQRERWEKTAFSQGASSHFGGCQEAVGGIAGYKGKFRESIERIATHPAARIACFVRKGSFLLDSRAREEWEAVNRAHYRSARFHRSRSNFALPDSKKPQAVWAPSDEVGRQTYLLVRQPGRRYPSLTSQ